MTKKIVITVESIGNGKEKISVSVTPSSITRQQCFEIFKEIIDSYSIQSNDPYVKVIK